MAKHVQEQKGPINPNPMTSKQESREQNVRERLDDYATLKRNQTLGLHIPKQ